MGRFGRGGTQPVAIRTTENGDAVPRPVAVGVEEHYQEPSICVFPHALLDGREAASQRVLGGRSGEVDGNLGREWPAGELLDEV